MSNARTVGWLEGLTENVKGERIEMKGDSFLIGRGAPADIQLSDPQVSREHARLTFADDQLKLEDLGSSHGTYVNGDPITATTLKNGDRIRFGGSLFHLHVPKGLLKEVEDNQDDIATVMAGQDDVATVLSSEDEVATQLASGDEVETVLSSDEGRLGKEPTSEVEDRCAHCGALLKPDEKFCGECGKPRLTGEPEATVRAEAVEPPPFTPPPPAYPPAMAQPAAPTAAGDATRKGLPGWLIAVLAGTAAVLVLGIGLVLAINLLGGEAEPTPDMLQELEATHDAFARDIESTPTLEQLQEEPTASGASQITDEPMATATAESVNAEEPTEAPPTEAPPSPDATQAPSSAAVLGGASGIAFASDRTGYPQVYYLDLNSRETSQLTDLPNGACQPAWSPDGSRLAYTSPCGSNREAYTGSTIFILEVDREGNPGEVRPLMISLGGGDYDPDWSPDGNKLAFTTQRTGRPQVFTSGIDGGDLFNVNDDLAHNWSPSWSGDGSQIAFLTGRGGAEEIWLVPSIGGEEKRFSRSDGKDVAKPDWSPDGATILFEKVVGSIPRIVAAPVADGGVRVVQICQEGQLSLQPMGEPAWSPDGTWVAFETWPGGGDHKIAIMQVSCNGYEELTEDPALDFDVAWRPAP